MSEAATTPLLDAELEGVAYPDGTPALHGVSVRIAVGDRLIVTGRSGCGKSTLLQVLSGVIPFCVSAQVRGIVRRHWTSPVDASRPPESAVFRQEAFLFQNPEDNLCATTVAEELQFSSENYGLAKEVYAARFSGVVEALGVSALLDRGNHELSQGQKQRVALASELIRHPKVVFLDEPTALLDVEGRDALLSVLGEGSALGESALVVATHDDDFAAKLEGTSLDLGRSSDTSRSPSDFPTVIKGPRKRLGDVVLAVRDLGFRWKGDPHPWVFRNVSFDVRAGEVVWLAGRNGAGKSVLLTVLAGLRRAATGHVLLDGRSIATFPSLCPEQITLVLQNPRHQLFTNSIRAEVELLAKLLGGQETTEATLQSVLAALGRTVESASLDPRALSFGQQKLLTILSFPHIPRVLLLDEPDFALDESYRRVFVELLEKRLREGTSVIFSSHNAALACGLADSVLMLRDGVAETLPTAGVRERMESGERALLS